MFETAVAEPVYRGSRTPQEAALRAEAMLEGRLEPPLMATPPEVEAYLDGWRVRQSSPEDGERAAAHTATTTT